MVPLFGLLSEKIPTEFDRFDGEVDDGWVLLDVESVLGEPLHVEDDVGGQPSQLELPQGVGLHVCQLCLTIELAQYRVQADLKPEL